MTLANISLEISGRCHFVEDWQVKGRREAPALSILCLKELISTESSFLHREMSQPARNKFADPGTKTRRQGTQPINERLKVTVKATNLALSARRETARSGAHTGASPCGHCRGSCQKHQQVKQAPAQASGQGLTGDPRCRREC